MFGSHMPHADALFLRIDHREHAIVGCHEMVAVAGSDNGTPRGAHAGIHNHQVYGRGREIGVGLRNRERSIEHVKRLHGVSDIDNVRVRHDVDNHAFDCAYKMIVGAVKGVIVDIVPDANIVDITHAVQAFDVLDGALAIAQTYSYFPTATVHLVVVDPGVGTARRPIIASSDGYHFVAPDNGVLSMVYAKEERIRVRHVTSEHYFRQPVSTTFHGRDIFAPVAAYLAKLVDSDKLGDEIED